LFYHVETTNGGTIDYYGEKDEDGNHLIVRLVCIKSAGGQETNTTFDKLSRPINVSIGNQTIIQLDWDAKKITEANGNISCNEAINSLTNLLSTQMVDFSNEILKSLPSKRDKVLTTQQTSEQMGKEQCQLAYEQSKAGMKEMAQSIYNVFFSTVTGAFEGAKKEGTGGAVIGGIGALIIAVLKETLAGTLRAIGRESMGEVVNEVVDTAEKINDYHNADPSVKARVDANNKQKATNLADRFFKDFLDSALFDKLVMQPWFKHCKETYMPCNANISATGGVGTRYYKFNLGKGAGTIGLSYEFFEVPDQISIRGAVKYSTGCVSNGQNVPLSFDTSKGNFYSGRQANATIQIDVVGDCTRKGSTKWQFTLTCP